MACHQCTFGPEGLKIFVKDRQQANTLSSSFHYNIKPIKDPGERKGGLISTDPLLFGLNHHGYHQ